ncbi:glutathione S-transferase GST-6.0 [mine drainage metagenome]|uniref:Glutathione S-transferase GST-6.0 n=1 Tax=mine drainage metagenome TaxID=410659 RepID=A0A1J5Q8T8_9ZZZZ
MKLYHKPGACSLSPHIVLREAGLAFELERVDLASKKTGSGGDYFGVNPKGYVPALALDDGQLLTEGPAIVQYLADLVPEKRLAPPAGTMERVRLQEWLNFIATELHKGFSPLYNPRAPEEWKGVARELLAKRIALVAERLTGRDYLMGDAFTVADAYLFTVLNWAAFAKVDLSPWPVLGAYQARVAARPAVRAALLAEGLIKA